MPVVPTAEDLLRVWECAEGEHPVDRALTLLALTSDLSHGDLAAMDIGRRDALLFEARASMFGETLQGFARCNQCAAPVEVALAPPPFEALPDEDADPAGWRPLARNGPGAQYRLPTSYDLAAIAGCESVEAARQGLAERCIRDADADGVAQAQLKISEHLAPAALDLDLTCPECGHVWTLDFDIGAYYWQEIRARALRLLREVEALASRFGWHERDILAMSDRRRSLYLELSP